MLRCMVEIFENLFEIVIKRVSAHDTESFWYINTTLCHAHSVLSSIGTENWPSDIITQETSVTSIKNVLRISLWER